jgi:periplasmic protein TonB
MKKYVVLCCVLLGVTAAYSQDVKVANDNSEKVYYTTDVRPQFPGDVNKYFTDNIVYPSDAKANKVQGTVYVNFIIEKDGSVTGAKVIKGIQGGISLEKEAVDVVSAMPKWTPGKVGGQNVRASFVVPIKFALGDK